MPDVNIFVRNSKQVYNNFGRQIRLSFKFILRRNHMGILVSVISRKGARYCSDCDCVYPYNQSKTCCPNCGNKFTHALSCMGRSQKEVKQDEKDSNNSSVHPTPSRMRSPIRSSKLFSSPYQHRGPEDCDYGETTINWCNFKRPTNCKGGGSGIETERFIYRLFDCFNVDRIFRKIKGEVSQRV